MQGQSPFESNPIVQHIIHGLGMLLMFALLAFDQSPLLSVIYDGLQWSKRTLLALF